MSKDLCEVPTIQVHVDGKIIIGRMIPELLECFSVIVLPPIVLLKNSIQSVRFSSEAIGWC